MSLTHAYQKLGQELTQFWQDFFGFHQAYESTDQHLWAPHQGCLQSEVSDRFRKTDRETDSAQSVYH
jgi:hypothetical protein